MAKIDKDALVRLDLNNPVFQENLLTLQKPERHAALDALNKLRQMTWSQVYRDNGLKWEKIISVKPPSGIDAIYSLRITQACPATAYRDGEFIRLLTIFNQVLKSRPSVRQSSEKSCPSRLTALRQWM